MSSSPFRSSVCPDCNDGRRGGNTMPASHVCATCDGYGTLRRLTLKCEFCGQFMRADGKGHEACLREYDRSVVGL